MPTQRPQRKGFEKLIYAKQPDNWYYLTEPCKGIALKIGFPEKLQIVETRRKEQIKSELICQSPQLNYKREFFTGLRPAGSENEFIGNRLTFENGNRKLRLILFRLSDEGQTLTVFHTFKFYKIHSLILDFAGKLLSEN